MLFCKHKELEFVQNLYGNESKRFGGNSLWKCKHCGKLIVSQTLRYEPKKPAVLFTCPECRATFFFTKEDILNECIEKDGTKRVTSNFVICPNKECCNACYIPTVNTNRL